MTSDHEDSRPGTASRPVMVLLDALGRRACLRVMWELRDGPLTFRELVAASESNPSVINSRLRELRTLAVVTHAPGGYRLTAAGEELLSMLVPLSAWAKKWLPAKPL